LPAIYWARQLTSLIIGLVFGVAGLTGAGAMMGCVANTVLASASMPC
jgi:hypothetical protein